MNYYYKKSGPLAAKILIVIITILLFSCKSPPENFDNNQTIQTGNLSLSELDEVSGIAASVQNSDLLWLIEDSDNGPYIYAVNPAGEYSGKITLNGVSNTDWEAIAIYDNGTSTSIFIGDIGDNNGSRSAEPTCLLEIEEPDVNTIPKPFDLTLTPVVYNFSYPDGQQNAEGLAILPDGIPIIVTKRTDRKAKIFKFPSLTSPVTLEYVNEISTGNDSFFFHTMATSADLWPDGSRMLIRTYSHLWEFRLGSKTIADIHTIIPVEVPFASETQGEAVSYDTVKNGYWQVSEGVNAPIYFTELEN